MTDYTRDYQIPMPSATDSLAASAGVSAVNTWIDEVDTELNRISGLTADTERAFYVWESTAASAYNLNSSLSVSDSLLQWTNVIAKNGTGTPQFFTTTGRFILWTEGFYRIIYHVHFNGATATDGFVLAGLAVAGSGAGHVGYSNCWVDSNTFGAFTTVHKSGVFRAAAAGGELTTGTEYILAFRHTNAGAVAKSMGGDANRPSWMSIEYLRPLT